MTLERLKGMEISSSAGRRLTSPALASGSSPSQPGGSCFFSRMASPSKIGWLRLFSPPPFPPPPPGGGGGDPRGSAVHQDMAVSDELPGDPARGGEAKAEDDVIKPPLEELSQG